MNVAGLFVQITNKNAFMNLHEPQSQQVSQQICLMFVMFLLVFCMHRRTKQFKAADTHPHHAIYIFRIRFFPHVLVKVENFLSFFPFCL